MVASVRVYLGIGSNLGDRLAHLQTAVEAIARHPEVTDVVVSRVYETEPVGGPEQGAYLNAVVGADTTLTPHALLDLAHQAEQAAERVRVERWGPRTLDVDVLWYGGEVIDDPDLIVPHPRMEERGFVQVPLQDVAPELPVAAPARWTGVRSTELQLVVP
jgi:2-amino-4-hydroxy-6-hydroxymethyldihydropteridine diphosphokinase